MVFNLFTSVQEAVLYAQRQRAELWFGAVRPSVYVLISRAATSFYINVIFTNIVHPISAIYHCSGMGIAAQKICAY